jgi:hypothetical protein
MGRPGSEYAQRKEQIGSDDPTEQRITFRVGAPQRPPIHHDNGHLDKYPRREPTLEDRSKYAQWRTKYRLAWLADKFGIRDLPDALPAYKHFWEGSGTPREIDYERFLDNDGSGHLVYNYARMVTRQAIESIYRTDYEPKLKSAGSGVVACNVTGSAIAVGDRIHPDHRFPQPETENWQKTLGSHYIWISADAWISWAKGTMPRFLAFIAIHAEDMYNFNPGDEDIATGIPDSDNGLFEITGLAKQYLNYGTYRWRETWMGATRDFLQVWQNLPGTTW